MAITMMMMVVVFLLIFNPYLERIPISVSKSQRNKISNSFKYYEVDGVSNSQQQSQSRAVLAANARRRDSSHNERFYEEHEYERRVKKRRARLITAAEENHFAQPTRQPPLPSAEVLAEDTKPDSKTTVSSEGAMSAIIGVQSPFSDQRSIVALLADSPRGYELLNDALLDSGKRAAVFGSVAVIRESGVNSLRVGDIYYVGHLPWWERLWYALSTHPVLLAVIAVVLVVILGLMLWRGLKAFSRRRLAPEDRD